MKILIFLIKLVMNFFFFRLAEDDVKVIIINNFKESEDVILQFNARDVADEIVNSKVKLMFM